jgi:D-alanyl-D-alanine endopeptidase (penicillin-binding protein 7)
MYHRFSIVDGEQILADDLFDAMLISSMNTPPRMLASTLSGGITAVVSEMNQIAHTQQLRDTAFADPAGVTLGNLSTAAEYAKLYTYITDTDQEIRTRLAQTGYEYTELVDLNDHPNHWDNHTNKLLKRTDLPFEILHSKTGYLYEAGTCLAMRIKRPSDGKEFIIVTLGNPDVGTYTRFDEPVRLATRVLAGR